MPFAYYDRLSRRARTIYDHSDRVARVDLPLAEGLRPLVDLLRAALEQDRRKDVEAIASRLCLGLTRALGVEDVEVVVLAVRPALREAELHGLYTRDGQRAPRIRVWMRTVRYKRVVAFRTFLRTLLHEVCHHLDYTYLKLEDSFHTEGFFKRESSLFHQLVPRTGAAPGRLRPRGDR
ncbi:MAG TPA: hypothetical protein VMT87_05215 [Vicinamibacteria bacterium]|nr:hypothetical protein [Vicinamibacteria bacterium]